MTTADTLRADARACFAAALAAVDPRACVARCLARDGDALVLRDRDAREVARHAGPVVVVGAGKGVAAMAAAAVAALGPALAHGIVIAPHGTTSAGLGSIALRTAAHPVPDAAGVAATTDLLRAVAAAPVDALVLVLLSGGASALLVAPAQGIAFEEKRELTRALVAAGAEIGGLNAVRKHLSAVKGGGLARAAAHAAAVWTLVLSDVVGDDLATIASGPAEADPTTYADALAVIEHHAIAMPPSIRRHLGDGAAGAIAETAKPGDPATTRVRSVLVGRNADALRAAGVEARRRGYHVTGWPAALAGDAAIAGRALAHAIARATSAEAIVAGGETTVRALPGGLGGRSQHLGLAAALELAGSSAVLLAAGTDGVDGPTDAAGACVDGGTIERARRRGLDPEAALAATDSHRLLAATGDLIRTGPTGTNVADVVVALARPA
ncbi:MAG TPA: DUF4147 domain-containing protein [Candidatus Eisenbacteria bacterium]|nr:DUF4147 domain-containing protein [Candidatus Eisenbacteria bacterium]